MPFTKEGQRALNAMATHPLASAVYVLRSADDDCVHLYLAGEDGIIIAEAVMISPIAESIARDLIHFASEHGGQLQ